MDDVVVNTDNGGVWFINVKTEVSVSTLAKSQLSSIADQFVRQWLEGGSSSSPSRRLDPARDRLVLVVKPTRSKSLVSGLTPVIRRLSDRASAGTDIPLTYTEGEKSAFEAFDAQLSFHWRRHKGSAPSRDELSALISCVRLIEFDLSGPTRAAVATMLNSIVEAEDVSNAIDALAEGCIDFARHRSGGDLKTLRDLLGIKKIRLKQRQHFQQDIARLQETTELALADMSRYASIRVHATDTTIQLQRACTDAVIDAALRGTSFLVIGEPGSGKSGALHGAAVSLRAAHKAVLMIQVDQLAGTTIEQLRQELLLSHPLLETLAEWRPEGGAVLMIDALDASRGTGSEPAVRFLITEVQKRAPHWVVVASIRKFDLRYGNQYHHLFEGRPVDIRFVDQEFVHVSHINIPRLTADEIGQVRSEWLALDRIAQASGTQFNSLLESPFNLYLLGRILEDEATAVNPARTQLDLLTQFWQRRVERDEFVAAEESAFALDRLLRRMLEHRRLTALNSDVPQSHMRALERLLRDGVLYQPHGTRLVSFGHHVLFDFALAKLIFLRDNARFIDDELVRAADDMLLVAPAIMLALRVVWEREPSRVPFWAVSLGLAGDQRLGSFVRALPSRVAAEAVQIKADVAPLIEALSKPQSKRTATSLAQHLLSVLLAGVVHGAPRLGEPGDPWCEIVESAAMASIDTLQWPLNAILSVWSEGPLTDDQRSALGSAARRLLSLQLKSDDSYNEGCIAAAIKTVVRTFSVSPTDSEHLIRAILDPQRVQDKGHKELFWLANGFKTLAASNAHLAADFLIAAFSAPLPSGDEKTSIGNSRILSLISSKRQDFEGVLHQLEEQISWFLAQSPAIAADAFRKLLTARLEADRPVEKYARTGEAELAGRLFKFRGDHSFIWWSASSRHYDSNAKLLEEFCSALRTAPDAHFEMYLDVVLQGEVPAAAVTACLRAASARGNPGSAMELLFSRDVLSMRDTSYDAAQLLASHYTELDPAQKTRVQEVIASVEDEQRREVLVGCIPDGEPVFNETLSALKAVFSEKPPPENVPHFSIRSGWRPSDNNSWLKEQGVDTESPSNKELLSAAEALKINDMPADDETALIKLESFWTQALEALDLLEAGEQVHQMVRNSVCDAVAEVAQAICDRAEEEAHFARFPGIRGVVSRCLRDDLDPLPVHSQDREEEFAKSASWGRPAPRIPASAALMAYVRAVGGATDEDRAQILKLARDPAVEIRHTVLARANLPCVSIPELSKELALIALKEERNEGVLSFFLGAFNNYVGQNLSWAPEQLLALDARLDPTGEAHRNDLRSALVLLILRLWIAWSVPEAYARLQLWVTSPLAYRTHIDKLLGNLRGLVVYGEVDISNERDDIIRGKGLQLYSALVSALAEAHDDLLSRAQESEDVRQNLSDAIRLLDSAADHLYFGSGAYALSRSDREATITAGPDERRRFIREYLPTLKRLARIPYPSITHPVLQIIEAFVADEPEEMLQLLFSAVREGGRLGGYQFESLGADLVVKIARKFLADYSGLIASQAEYRVGLVEVLNLFAETGWPEARKLVYQLPEMLR